MYQNLDISAMSVCLTKRTFTQQWHAGNALFGILLHAIFGGQHMILPQHIPHMQLFYVVYINKNGTGYIWISQALVRCGRCNHQDLPVRRSNGPRQSSLISEKLYWNTCWKTWYANHSYLVVTVIMFSSVTNRYVLHASSTVSYSWWVSSLRPCWLGPLYLWFPTCIAKSTDWLIINVDVSNAHTIAGSWAHDQG